MLAKVVNANAGNQTPRIALRFFASKLAPTAAGLERLAKPVGNGPGPKPLVGASLLAKVVNDYAGNQTPRIALRFFASKLAPTGGGVGTLAGIRPVLLPSLGETGW